MIKISQAMILAAGRGTRMRPLTNTRPKPLVSLSGRALIDHTLERLEAVGVRHVVVNAHHFGDQVEEHLSSRPEVSVSYEPELLETGGGVNQALEYFGNDAFLVLNCDVVWLDGAAPALSQLMDGWRAEEMDALLLLYPVKEASTHRADGDYDLDETGRVQRRKVGQTSPFLFTGLQILHPRLFKDAPVGPYSLNLLYDTAEQASRLYAVVHDGRWFHVGTPDELRYAEQQLSASSVAASSP